MPRTRMGVGCGTDLSRACGAFASRLAPTGAQRGSPHRAGSPRAYGRRDDGGGRAALAMTVGGRMALAMTVGVFLPIVVTTESKLRYGHQFRSSQTGTDARGTRAGFRGCPAGICRCHG
ncbi:MAG: hypothetical protein R6T90_05500, partial [Dissulfuribacterales bacterium]